MDNQLSFGRWLKVCRVALRMTQAELAERIGYSTITIRKLESDDLRPSLQIAERLTDQLALPPQDWPDFIRFARGEAGGNGLRLPSRVAEVLQPAPPGHLPMQGRPHMLPTAQTPLIGRIREQDDVKALLLRQDVRLVTLTGPGGIGKTRLALQVARNLPLFDEGVCFVDLAPIREPGFVGAAVAQALDTRPAPGQALQDSLHDYLRDKQFLLLLDNFEQVISAAAFVVELLAACPRLKLLVTSREALRLYGEKQYPVPPLQAPHPDRLPNADHLAQFPVAALFLQRAQDVKPDFCLTDENAPAVAAICAYLDGLPLAIELAAARVKLLPPEALLARLVGTRDQAGSSLQLLTGGARNLPARQHTLRSTIDWSYRLLEPWDQRVLARLAVFVGGCTLEAAEAVCDHDNSLPVTVLDALQSLVDKSLVRLEDQTTGELRFTMLEMIREFALERLGASDEQHATRLRHSEYYLAMAEAAMSWIRSADQLPWIARLEGEHENMRAALGWSLEHDRIDINARMVAALGQFWILRGHWSEAAGWGERLMIREDAVPASFLPTVLYYTGHIVGSADEERGRTLLERCAERARAQGDRETLGHAIYLRATFDLFETPDKVAVRTLMEQSVALFEEVGPLWALARAVTELGNVAYYDGRYEETTLWHERGLALARQSGDRAVIAYALNRLGKSAFLNGDYGRAKTFFREALALSRELGDTRAVTFHLGMLGEMARHQAEYATASEYYHEQLRLERELGNRIGQLLPLSNLGLVAFAQGDVERAQSRFQESLTLAQDGRWLFECAYGLEGLAEVALARGQPQHMAHLWGAAESVRQAINIAAHPIEVAHYDALVAQARAMLTDQAFEMLRAEGQAMSLKEAIAYALKEAGPAEPRA